MIRYYREKDTGDYLCIDASTARYYLDIFDKDLFEGRATAIGGQVGSVCTTSISRQYLRKKCKWVAKSKVPAEWRKAIGY
jgi:hypothetical protein